LFGNCCDRTAVDQFARSYGLKIVWDAAQAHGGGCHGQDVAGWSPLVCFSLYATKNLFVGEGGMVCTDDALLAASLRAFRSHGQDPHGAWQRLGFNYRMSDVQAALGLAQLERFEEMAAQRRSNAERMKQGLAEVPGLRSQKVTPGCQHAWHRYAVLVDTNAFGMARDDLACYLAERGIATAVHYRCGVHQEPFFTRRFGRRSLAVTECVAKQVLALPIHHGLSERDIDQIVHAIHECRRFRSGRIR
jgi:perosamine synthetase